MGCVNSACLFNVLSLHISYASAAVVGFAVMLHVPKLDISQLTANAV